MIDINGSGRLIDFDMAKLKNGAPETIILVLDLMSSLRENR